MAGAGWRGVVVVVVGLLGLATPAGAVTTVSGDKDSNSPLVIDPSSDPTDALTLEKWFPSGTPTAFVQRMPVTKVVDEVTIGDIGQAPSCGSVPTRTRLLVREHDGDDIALGGNHHEYMQIAYSPAYVSLPAEPGQVTYQIPPTTLREGRGYSFRISANYSANDCKLARYTTWAHNAGQVNAGPATCTIAPLSKRMWHEVGLDDAHAECVTRSPQYRKFEPSMPTGWLVSRHAASNWDILTGRYEAGGVFDACETAASTDPRDLGGDDVFWQELPETNPDWVCAWQQFADHGDTVQDGWYYAHPWPVERGGAPRDMYLELGIAGYGTLLEDHAPVLKYDSGENFHAISPGAMTDFYELPPGGQYNLSDSYVNTLRDDSDDEIAAAGSPGPGSGPWPPVMVLGVLGESYWFGPDPADQPAAASSDYLNPRGDSESTYAADAASMEALSTEYPDKVYGRIAYGGNDGSGGEEDDKLWLQYWMFYYHNPIEIGEHEGDWEMIQVGLDAAGNPDVVVYNQHTGGQVCAWSEIETSGDHPVVYVAEGSHASYYAPDQIPLKHFYDHADGLGGTLASPVIEEVMHSDPTWVAWPGTWGNRSESPVGPRFQGEKWSDPTAWKDGLDSC